MRCALETNRCRRLVHSVIRENSQRKLVLCPEISDGKWSQWEGIEECRGRKTVQLWNGTCGEGHQRQKRHCIRELGGNPCTDENAEDFREYQKIGEDFELRSDVCFSGDCPGELEAVIL